MNLQNEIQKKIEGFGNPKYFFQPLQITFMLGSPIMLNYPWISFDGLISHLQTQNILENVWDLLPPRNPLDFVKDIPLPIKKIKFEEDYFYQASVSIFEKPSAISKTIIHKKFDDIHAISHLNSKKKNVDLVRGKYKLYAMTLPINYSKHVTFYCNGDKKAIQELCQKIQFLGKKRSVGYGEVINYKIEIIKQDFSIWQNGITNRMIPVKYFESKKENYQGHELAILAYKPPYWNKANVDLCVIPEVIEQ